MINLDELKSINLIEFANRHFDLRIQANGQAKCPFHEDSRPSFSVYRVGNNWFWKDHHDGKSGSIIDLVMELEKIGIGDAIKRFKHLEGIEDQLSSRGPSSSSYVKDSDIARIHAYLDETGALIWQKIKLRDGSYRCRRKDGEKWVYSLNGINPIPYRLNTFIGQPSVFLCEGEKDADTLSALGYPSTSGPFGKSSWPDDLTPWFAGKEIRIIYDVGNDDAARQAASKLFKVSEKIELLLVPLEAHEADITDYLDQFKTPEEKREKFAEIVARGLHYVPWKFDSLRSQLVGLDTVLPERVDWLWHNRFPLGKLSLICGDPGDGKSYFSIFMAAHVSTGRDWPDIPGPIPQGSVIILTAEDGLADTVRPRADANLADVSKIKIIEGIKDQNGVKVFNLIEHIPQLEEAVQAIEDVRLVVIDPITAYLGETDSHKNADVRRVLAPLSKIAEQNRIAVLAITHLNKDTAKKAVYRTMGSLAFTAAARAVWAITRDENDNHRRLFLPIKTNLSHDPKGLAFRIENSRLIFEDQPIEIRAEDALSNEVQDETTAIAQACEWLQEALSDGTLPAKDCFRMAKDNSISEASLRRAKQKLGVRSSKHGALEKSRWMWELPKMLKRDQLCPT